MPRSIAVVTGASSGIGREFARRLAPSHDLWLVARREPLLAALAQELRAAHGTDVTTLTADLADPADVARLARRIADEPKLGLLINNAGFGHRDAFWEADLGTLEAMHRLHVMAVLRLTHAALAVLVREDRGAVINVASVASFGQRAGSASYGATKSWLATLTEGIHLDLMRAGSATRVQALCPGFTYSGFHDVIGEDRTELAPRSLWLTAEAVVAASLRALERGGPVVVIPGWRYKVLVAVITKLPLRLKFWAESRGLPRGRR
jgi:short-subunit dehydrogenase